MARSYHAGGGKTPETLCSGKHHKAGYNLQILTDQAGEIFYISPPLPGSTHDITAIRNTGLFGYMQPWHITADKGYVGLGCDTPFKRRPGKPLLEWQKRFNKGINQIRYVVERSIAHLKTWRILSTPCRLPPTHNYSGNQCDTEDNVLPTTSRTMFPQRLNKLHWLVSIRIIVVGTDDEGYVGSGCGASYKRRLGNSCWSGRNGFNQICYIDQ